MRTIATQHHRKLRGKSLFTGVLVTLFLLVAIVPAAWANDAIPMQLQPPVGQELVYRVTLRAAEAAGPEAPPLPIALFEFAGNLHVRLGAPDEEGVYPFEYWVDHVTLRSGGFAFNDVVDSERRSGTLVLTPEVNVLTFEESPALYQFGVSLRDAIRAIFPNYPSHPLRVGDRWEYTYDVQLDEVLRRPMHVTHTLTELDTTRQRATFSAISTMEYSVDFDFDGVQTTVGATIRGQSVYTTDTTTGLLLQSTSENRENGSITDTMGYRVPLHFVTQSTLERILD